MTKVDLYKNMFYSTIEWMKVDPERAHDHLLQLLETLEKVPLGLGLTVIQQLAQAQGYYQLDGELGVQVGNLHFEHPVILAEGFSKNAKALPALLDGVGFSGAIVGTVTREPQIKNPGNVLWRLPNGGLLNHHGFGNDGAVAVADELATARQKIKGTQPIGVSIGMNREVTQDEAAEAHRAVAEILGPLADFVVVNVASPNTKNLRGNLAYSQLSRIVEKVKTEMSQQGTEKLVFIKLSPDMNHEQIDDVIRICHEQNCHIVATNTSNNLELKQQLGIEDLPGGISGPPISERALSVVQYVRQQAPDLIVIGEGGINSPVVAQKMLNAGANLLGIYTALVTEGPTFPTQLVMDLLKFEQMQQNN